jgi:23S rRNA (adenine2503-C2)-methyltransferase
LLAYKPVVDSIALICSEEGMGMAPRRITVSTAGIAKMIKKMADDGLKTNLALSLHAADDFKRNQIMPINEQNNLSILAEALQYFQKNTKDNKITFEYIAFRDFNDEQEDAENLLRLCRKVSNVKVNIIEYNKVDGVELEKSEDAKIDEFARFLSRNGVAVTVRRSRGKDIDAACGQLANK